MIDNNLKIILDEFEQLKGQFIITMSHTIERLVAIGDDEEDYYWVTWDGRNLHWSSCVGRIIPLKGYLRDDDYNELIRLAKLNHSDQIYLENNQNDEFLKNVDDYMSTLSEKDKFLTILCWDLC